MIEFLKGLFRKTTLPQVNPTPLPTPWPGFHIDYSNLPDDKPREPSPQEEQLKNADTSWLGFQMFQTRYSDRIPGAQVEVMKQYRSWIYTFSNMIADAGASVPWHLYAVKKNGERLEVEGKSVDWKTKQYFQRHPSYSKTLSKSRQELVEILEHPFIDLMNEGNMVSWAGFDLLHLTFLCRAMVGNAFWYMPSNKLGVPERLYLLLPHLTWLIPNYSTGDALLYGTAGSIFQPKDVAHFACPSPLSTWTGFGPGQAAWFQMKKLEQTEEFENSLQKNGVFPSGLLTPETPLTDEQVTAAEDWLSKTSGVRKAGKLIVPPWPAKLLAPQIQTDAIRFLADHSVPQREIAGAFRVPIAMIEEPKSAANAFWATQQFAKNAIQPACNGVASTINRKIISRYESRKPLFFAFENSVPQDEDMTLKWLKLLLTGQCLQRQELRRIVEHTGRLPIDLPPTGDSEKDEEYPGGRDQFNSRQPEEMSDVVAPTGTQGEE